mmetsp:Transcript_15183/g.36871  ORF Transcript_15183/g.36871 Transcript_15183/m.36871 type:complete len:380 (-) Transcript_15183:91-1230(-)
MGLQKRGKKGEGGRARGAAEPASSSPAARGPVPAKEQSPDDEMEQERMQMVKNLEDTFGKYLGGLLVWLLTQISRGLLWLLAPDEEEREERKKEETEKEQEEKLVQAEAQAWQRFKEGRHDDALKQLQKLLETRQEREEGRDVPETAAIHSKMSRIFVEKGKLFEAWMHANLAHNTFEVLRDKEKYVIHLAKAKHDIALVYQAQKKFARAQEYFESAIEHFEKGETEDNSKEVSASLLRVHGDIAAVKVQQEDWAGAAEALRGVLERRGTDMGDHAEVANVKAGLAACLIKQGSENPSDLLELYEDCERIYVHCYGKKHRVSKWATEKVASLRKELKLEEESIPRQEGSSNAPAEAAGQAEEAGAPETAESNVGAYQDI